MSKAEEIELTQYKRYKRQIPLRYTFIHPITVDFGKDITLFGDNTKNVKLISPTNMRAMGVGKNNLILKFDSNKPIELNPEETFVYFYKKDVFIAIIKTCYHVRKACPSGYCGFRRGYF